MCLAFSGKAWGWSRCSICHVKQAAFAFESWLAQHRSCNGDQVCSNCWNCPIPRGSISKAVQRVAATQAKVGRRAAEEKKARAIADVWDAIAERKRNREQESPPNEGRRAEGKTSQTRERNRNDHRSACRCTWQTGRQQRKAQGGAANEGRRSHGQRQYCIFQYMCPHCNQPVSSTIRTGQVDHRRTCGNSFPVREGRPCAKPYDYVCPACNGHVASNVATGQIDHRTVCGNKFSVQDGVVK